MSESEIIDQILLAAKEGHPLSIDSEKVPNHFNAIRTVKAYNLVRFENALNGTFRYWILEETGHQVLEAGGFDKWRQEKARKESEIYQAAIDAARATVDASVSAKRSFWLTVLVTGISIIPIVISILQYVDSKEKDEKIEYLQKKVTSLALNMKSTTASVQSLKSSQQRTSTPLSPSQSK